MANTEETHRATVTDTDDPEKRGRIKVTSSSLLGSSDADVAGWIEPVWGWGWFTVPDVGESIEIVVAAQGDMDESFGQASLEEPDIRWRGARMWTTEDGDTPRVVPDDFTTTNYGKRRGFATPQGHLLMFDDTEGKEKVTLMWHGVREGADKFGLFTLDEDGSVVMSNINGSLLYMNAKDGELTMVDEHGNSYTSNVDGIKLIDHFSNIIEMKDGVIQIISQDAVVVTGSDFSASTGSVNLVDGADTPIVRGGDLVSWLAAHTHVDAMGGTGPPVQPIPPAVLSTDAKVK
jgi:hypothetical protein